MIYNDLLSSITIHYLLSSIVIFYYLLCSIIFYSYLLSSITIIMYYHHLLSIMIVIIHSAEVLNHPLLPVSAAPLFTVRSAEPLYLPSSLQVTTSVPAMKKMVKQMVNNWWKTYQSSKARVEQILIIWFLNDVDIISIYFNQMFNQMLRLIRKS